MTNTSSQKKESLLRSLAIAGLVAIIILIAWLSVQIVKVAPSAFSSLASLAEGLNQYDSATDEMPQEALAVEISNGAVASGETTTLMLGEESDFGTYTFMYECTDGVSLSSVAEDGTRQLDCGTTYNLDNNKITLRVDSERTTDQSIAYSIGFLRPTDELPFRSAEGTFVANAMTESLAEESTEELEGQVAGESTTNEEVATQPETPVDPEPTVQFVTQIPTSNPNGTVDLATKYIGVGDNSGLTGTLDQDSSGVFFFEVKNIGTKTSDDWRFTVALPDGDEYVSARQAPLKPNERATLALTVNTDDDSSHTFRVEVETDEDRRDSNNTFTQRVILR